MTSLSIEVTSCRLRFETIPDLDLAADRFRQVLERDPIGVAYRKRSPHGIFSNHDPIQIRLDLHDILRLARRDETLPLSDRKLVNSLMLANDLAVFRHDLARGTGVCPLCLAYSSTKSAYDRPSTKQISCDSALSDVGKPARRAISRTSGFVSSPSGNKVLESCS